MSVGMLAYVSCTMQIKLRNGNGAALEKNFQSY